MAIFSGGARFVTVEAVAGAHQLTVFAQAHAMPPGQRLSSDVFHVGGHAWRLDVYPGGFDARCAGFVSACLELAEQPQATSAGSPAPPPPLCRFELALVDAAGGEPVVCATPPDAAPVAPKNGRLAKARRFVSWHTLWARPGLAGEAAVFRATVQVVKAGSASAASAAMAAPSTLQSSLPPRGAVAFLGPATGGGASPPFALSSTVLRVPPPPAHYHHRAHAHGSQPQQHAPPPQQQQAFPQAQAPPPRRRRASAHPPRGRHGGVAFADEPLDAGGAAYGGTYGGDDDDATAPLPPASHFADPPSSALSQLDAARDAALLAPLAALCEPNAGAQALSIALAAFTSALAADSCALPAALPAALDALHAAVRARPAHAPLACAACSALSRLLGSAAWRRAPSKASLRASLATFVATIVSRTMAAHEGHSGVIRAAASALGAWSLWRLSEAGGDEKETDALATFAEGALTSLGRAGGGRRGDGSGTTPVAPPGTVGDLARGRALLAARQRVAAALLAGAREAAAAVPAATPAATAAAAVAPVVAAAAPVAAAAASPPAPMAAAAPADAAEPVEGVAEQS